MSMVAMSKRLGELLREKGLISAGQLEQALQEQRSTGELLGELLLRKGWVKEEALLQTLGEQMDIPYVHLANETVDWSLAGRFPATLLTDHLCFPLRLEGQYLIAAIANPLDAWVVSKLEQEATNRGRKVQLVLASSQEIREAIGQAKQQAMNSWRMPPT